MKTLREWALERALESETIRRELAEAEAESLKREITWLNRELVKNSNRQPVLVWRVNA